VITKDSVHAGPKHLRCPSPVHERQRPTAGFARLTSHLLINRRSLVNSGGFVAISSPVRGPIHSFTSHVNPSSRVSKAGKSRREKLLIFSENALRFSAPTQADFLI
jgi:hypothetical protein